MQPDWSVQYYLQVCVSGVTIWYWIRELIPWEFLFSLSQLLVD